jgi:excisionase family DNA binding protein
MYKNQGTSAPTEIGDLATRIELWPHALTAPEFAGLMGLGKTAIYDLAKRGGIPHYRVAGSIRLDPATTAAWLRKREVAFPERLAASENRFGAVSGTRNRNSANDASTGSAVTA